MMERKPRDIPKRMDDLVITCMDFRYLEIINQILKDKHYVSMLGVDYLSIAGASKGVVEGELMPSVEIGYKKHGVKNIWMFDHIDCGGFGGQAAYDNDERKEAEAHFESQDRAQEAIHRLMPELVVVSYVIGLDGEPVER